MFWYFCFHGETRSLQPITLLNTNGLLPPPCMEKPFSNFLQPPLKHTGGECLRLTDVRWSISLIVIHIHRCQIHDLQRSTVKSYTCAVVTQRTLYLHNWQTFWRHWKKLNEVTQELSCCFSLPVFIQCSCSCPDAESRLMLLLYLLPAGWVNGSIITALEDCKS